MSILCNMPKLPSMEQIMPSMERIVDLLTKSILGDDPASATPPLIQPEQQISTSKMIKTPVITKTPEKTPSDRDRIRAIPDSLFIELILSIWSPNRTKPCRVVDRNQGSSNYCVTLRLNENAVNDFVVRVPFNGTRETWTEEDALELRNDVMSMRYVFQKTELLVPQVHEWDAGFDNILGAPFTIMDRMYGVSAYENLWYEDEMWVENAEGIYVVKNADKPSPELERRRQNFLKDLAEIMADLQNHEFSKMGALHMEDRYDAPPPTIGHYFRHVDGKGMVKRGPYDSTAEYIEARMKEFREVDFTDVDDEDERRYMLGNIRIASVMSDVLPRSVDKHVTDEDYETAPETFVLAHPDLDLQNIFVDEDGSITGIIDWSGLRAVPRWAGWSSLPLFLRKDFEWDFNCRGETSAYPLMTWQLDPYRKAYDRYLQAALDPDSTGSYNDGKYTLKSGATCAALDALEFEAIRDENLHRLLKELPQLNGVVYKDFKERLGSEEGWPEAEAMLKEAFRSLFMHTS
jgi:hypothetical protein